MDIGSLVFMVVGIFGIVSGYAVTRLRNVSIKDVRNKKRRPAVTGISATILGIGIIIGNILLILAVILPRNETVRLYLSCTNIMVFTIGTLIFSLILEGIRNMLTPSEENSET